VIYSSKQAVFPEKFTSLLSISLVKNFFLVIQSSNLPSHFEKNKTVNTSKLYLTSNWLFIDFNKVVSVCRWKMDKIIRKKRLNLQTSLGQLKKYWWNLQTYLSSVPLRDTKEFKW